MTEIERLLNERNYLRDHALELAEQQRREYMRIAEINDRLKEIAVYTQDTEVL